MSLMGPTCAKTRASRECAESCSPFSSFDCDCQCCSFPIQRNRDKLSTRKFDVGVFTQAGSKADLTTLKCDFRSFPNSGPPTSELSLPKSAIDRDRGEPFGSAPPTPPCVRVRTRRFEKLR